jgi:hypothetical protein
MKIPLLVAAGLLLVMGFVHATGSAPVTPNTVQSLNGYILHITGAFTVESTTFIPTAVDSPATPVSCVWLASTGCSTAQTSGDWVFLVHLVLNNPPTMTTTYSITVYGSFTSSSISFSVPSGLVPSGMNFAFDTSRTTLLDPTVITVIVQ